MPVKYRRNIVLCKLRSADAHAFCFSVCHSRFDSITYHSKFKRVKLACKRQGERIFAKGEYLGNASWYPFFFGDATRAANCVLRSRIQFTYPARRSGSLLTRRRAWVSSPKANTWVTPTKRKSRVSGFFFL